MQILGISAYYHDAAAALIVDGDIVAAAQEERFTRKKHDPAFPCERGPLLSSTRHGISADDIDCVAFYDKPFLKFERLLETYLAFAPRGFTSFRHAMPLWIKDKLFQKRLLSQGAEDALGDGVDWGEAALLRAPSEPRRERLLSRRRSSDAAVLTMDGVGEWTTTSLALGHGNDLEGHARDPLPAFARTALLGLHLLHRIQGQLRRIQADGPRALRRAQLSPI